MKFSNYALEAAGFLALSDPSSLSARFHCLQVYAIRGIILEEPALTVHDGEVLGRPYRLAVGMSVNAISHALVNDDMVESEQDWQRDRKCVPPYLTIHFGPTDQHVSVATHAKVEESIIETFDGFPEARAQLDEWKKVVLPSLLAGLKTSFSILDQPVNFSYVDHVNFGKTVDGKTIIDIRYISSGCGYFSMPLTKREATNKISAAINYATAIRPKVAGFLHLGLQEDDLLKRFLFLFLAVEIEVHAVFACIDRSSDYLALLFPPSKVASTAETLFNTPPHHWNNLRDRFALCAVRSWPQLSDSDVSDFKIFKRIRDDIAHGTLSTPPPGSVRGVEKLAVKLQLSNI